jgi:peptide deformylase
MILKIIKYPNPVLGMKANTIKENSKELQKLISDMFDTLESTSGIGLAAPQVGESLRLFITKNGFFAKEKVYINPVIVDYVDKRVFGGEGCLSVIGKTYNVKRYVSVTMKYLDKDFVEHTEIFRDFPARLIQHEYDHLRGITLVERSLM